MPRSILILTNRIPYPLHDGGALAMDAMIRGYAAAGWEVHLLAMNTVRHRVPDEKLATLYSDLAGFYVTEVDNSFSKTGILKNLFLSREPEHVGRFRSDAFAQILDVLLQTIGPDAVQLESPFLATYLPLIREECGVVIYRMHNVEGQIWRRLATASSGLKKLYLANLSARLKRYEERLWREVDLLLPITETDADAVRSAGVDTPLVVAPFAPQCIKADGNIVRAVSCKLKAYHIGAMDWLANREGVCWFLDEVWPMLHEWAPEVEFHFAGRAMPESFYKNLPEGVFCAGEVADADAFIADKDLLVVPIRSGGGIRVKILEAMAAGKLVVSTDVGMQGIDAQPELHYLRANSAQEFAHLIAWATTHAEKVDAVTSTAQELIRERYNASAIMEKVASAVENLVGQQA